MLEKGKLNILIDGQFGSTGKGLVASYIGERFEIDIAVSNASANAGHTFYINGKKMITHFLPVSGIINPDSIIYISAGSIIDPKEFMKELEIFNIDKNRVKIHPRAAIIEERDRFEESCNSLKGISSTLSGTGAALVRKIGRSASLAKDEKCFNSMILAYDLQYEMDRDRTVFMEVPQGLDLSINSGLAYPHCTSREITVPAAMSDAQVHPHYLGKTITVIRTYPIRVANAYDEDQADYTDGWSGPFYPDSIETTWKKIDVLPEYTTVTKKKRRVATFSIQQYKRMLWILRPDTIFLNFANYFGTSQELIEFLGRVPEVDYLGYGPRASDIVHKDTLLKNSKRSLKI